MIDAGAFAALGQQRVKLALLVLAGGFLGSGKLGLLARGFGFLGLLIGGGAGNFGLLGGLFPFGLLGRLAFLLRGQLSRGDPGLLRGLVRGGRTAGTLGYGTEFDLGKNWSAKAEYDYLSFGRHTALASDGTAFLTDRSNISQVKVGVNYRFGPGMVVAKC